MIHVDDWFERKWREEQRRVDDEDAFDSYCEELDEKIMFSGVWYGDNFVCRADVDSEWLDSEECAKWLGEYKEASAKDRIKLTGEYENRKYDWRLDVYIPRIAREIEELLREYDK